MDVLTIVILTFSLIGAVDYIIGNKIGIGKEFEKAFSLFCPMALSMLGMIVIAPAIGTWLTPVFDGFYKLFGIDPSIIPASLFANDMGGMTLAQTVCKSEQIGNFNAFVVSSMMGCVISFTIPFSLGIVRKEQHKELFFGILCGIVTIPIGCFVAGLLCEIDPLALLINLLPLVLLSVIVGAGLIWLPKLCIKGFAAFGFVMKTLALIGLGCAIFTFLTKVVISPHFDTLENAAFICVNACVTLSGALPLMHIVAKLLHKPLNALGSKIGINGVSALAFLGNLVTNASTFGVMDKMDKKGTVLNAAFAVSAAFVFGSHLAFTMAFDGGYVAPMIVGKLVSGVCAVVLALLLYKADAPQRGE
ncbi:MAG: ethanolamine utilization protein EutH [Oscillospiraceae bacterium]|nr:ethanolamine utilization protein EutH [Oscillospiraceae bacterium]